ncbi:MAG: hypothetical protein WCC00_10110, partial [Candidatus Aminicenantales bacterium]
LTVPVVRDRLFGAKPRPEPETTPFPPPPPGEAPAPPPEPVQAPAGSTTRVLVKSHREIENELDKLSKEYVGK